MSHDFMVGFINTLFAAGMCLCIVACFVALVFGKLIFCAWALVTGTLTIATMIAAVAYDIRRMRGGKP